MKKNIFTDNKSNKGSKGFYAALGISAVMIGSACYFAYNQGEKLVKEELIAESSISDYSDEAVDKKYTDIPKLTTTSVTERKTTTTQTQTTTTVTTTTNAVTIPAAAISVDEPPVANETETIETAADKLSNISPPLADVSNIISLFSGTELVKNETTGSWQTHNGTDIAAEIGAEVFAISAGEITAVNDDPLWGTTVVIDHHNGYITRYCSLAKDLSVQVGTTVVGGDSIGAIGDTADIESALPSHLHIEIIHNGNYIDPMEVLNS